MCFLFILFYGYTFSQEIKDIDKLTIDICNTIIKSTEKNDSVRIQVAFDENLIPFMGKFKLNELSDELLDKIDFRIQKNCDWYQKYLFKKYEYDEKSDWKILNEKPKSNITTKECNDFFKKHTKFYYLESEGEKTEVDVSNNLWIDKFTDGTYSKLSFKLNDCHFELRFIESNNLGRKNYSAKDDIYYYDIIKIEGKTLTVLVALNNSTTYYQFKLYALD